MSKNTIFAAMGKVPFDLAVKDVRLVNVLTSEIYPCDIGVADGQFAYVGRLESCHSAKRTIDGQGFYAAPGFIDSHMHIESSMMTPANFAAAVLPLGTTSVAADPHEMGNVLGTAGVRLMTEMSRNLPLHVHVLAPSTIPSAPGFETSGAEIGGKEMEEMLAFDGILGLGEVMDFHGVIAGDQKLMDIIDAAKKAGVLLDGHVPALKGRELQAFAASGIDCDHTFMDPEIVAEKLRYGISVQIQERFLTRELMAYLNTCPVQSRIMLVTDDVPITRLAARGHIDGILRKAMALGLDPMRAYRYVTINAADRLRLYHRGAVAPGRGADLVLLSSLEEAKVEMVFSDGRLVAERGALLEPLAAPAFPDFVYHTIKLPRLSAEDFTVRAKDPAAKNARVNVIRQDGLTSRTCLEQALLPVEKGVIGQKGLMKAAVFERHTGKAGRSLGFIGNMAGFRGALATTYAHDCHNLAVYSSNDADAVLAANTLIEMGGGVAAVLEGRILSAIPLPIGGILCTDGLKTLAEKFSVFDRAARTMGLNHQEPLTFLTLMSLAVSPEVKLTDRGLIDVMTKTYLPLEAK
ncbi:MAG: adenine deaminase C-terminal domain-containing protein [Peptococcaceae bacterium]|nr:adenine deaminase C-terminal domain-containing protein [Peptococcaceae bacterium]